MAYTPSTTFTVGGSYTPTTAFQTDVLETGSVSATIEQAVYGTGATLATVENIVYETGTVSATIEQQITGYSTGAVDVLIEQEIYGLGSESAGIEQVVYLSGAVIATLEQHNYGTGSVSATIEQRIVPDIYTLSATVEQRNYGTGSVSASVAQVVYETGTVSATIEQQIAAVTGIAIATLRQALYETGAAAATIQQQIVDHETGTVSATIEQQIFDTASGVISATIEQVIYGSATVVPASGVTQRWSAKVYLGGVDVSASVTGLITVDGEEGMARVATFVIKPAFGAIDIATWVNQPVHIDYVLDGATFRLFTGRVDLPSYDPMRRLTSFRCSDFLQKRFETMSREQIAAEVGGRWSNIIFNEPESQWQYAQDRLSTVPASYDLDVNGQGHLTLWNPGTLPNFEFTDALVLGDGLTAPELSPSRDVVNQLEISFGFRFERLHERTQGYSWQMMNGISWAQVAENSIPLPTQSFIEEAIASSEWLVAAPPVYDIAPAFVNYGYYDGTGRTGGQITLQPKTVLAAGFTLAKRWAQQVTELCQFIVKAPQSTEQVGLNREEREFSHEQDATSLHFYNVFEETTNTLTAQLDSTAVGTSALTPITDTVLPYQQYKYAFPSGAVSQDYSQYLDLDEIKTTNLLTWSEQFASWAAGGHAAVTSNALPSVIGTQTADRLDVGVGGRRSVTLSCAPGTTYSFSVYLRDRQGHTGSIAYLAMTDNDTSVKPNGTTAPTVSAVQCVLGTLWARYSCEITTGPIATELTVSVGRWNGQEDAGNVTRFGVDRAMLNEGGTVPTYVASNGSPGQGQSLRDLVDEAVLCAKHQAKTEILAAHRKNYVEFKTPLNPLVERHHRVRLDTPVVQATGKVHQVVHELDTGTGSALTTIRLALSKVIATSVPDPTPIVAPGKAVQAPVAVLPDEYWSAGALATYVGNFPDRTYPYYDYTMTPTGVTRHVHPPLYGYLCDAEMPRTSFTLTTAVKGYGEARFVLPTPAVGAANTSEHTEYKQSETIITIPDDELSLAA